MPGPAVYAVVAVIGVVAVGYAFHELVYEPHIAPKVEAWAESYLQRRKEQKQKQKKKGPLLAQPLQQNGNENGSRRSTDASSSNDWQNNANPVSMSIELEELAKKERSAWSQPSSSGLRQRKHGAPLDDSDIYIPHPIMAPTHVIFDSSSPPSPDGQSSSLSSLDNSPTTHEVILPAPLSPSMSPAPRGMLPTPMSNYSALSSTSSDRSSSRQPTPDLSASQVLPSAYNTPLGGSMLFEVGRVHSNVDSLSSSRVQSPFSDVYAADAHSPTAQSPIASPRVRSPSVSSTFTLESDEDFDVMSHRSGMFSPPSRVDDDPFEVLSQHGSDVSWTSVGRRSPGPSGQ